LRILFDKNVPVVVAPVRVHNRRCPHAPGCKSISNWRNGKLLQAGEDCADGLKSDTLKSMAQSTTTNAKTRMAKFCRFSSISFLGLAAALYPAAAQVKPGGAASVRTDAGVQSLVERGKYIVESVAMCEQCHTPLDGNGNPDRSRWLAGGPLTYKPAQQGTSWPLTEPRIARRPPGTDAEFIRLLTTGISRTGSPPSAPMPQFRMTRADAEAVLAYLKSLQ
jgi:mono/diheme cytochrome c family protein